MAKKREKLLPSPTEWPPYASGRGRKHGMRPSLARGINAPDDNLELQRKGDLLFDSQGIEYLQRRNRGGNTIGEILAAKGYTLNPEK